MTPADDPTPLQFETAIPQGATASNAPPALPGVTCQNCQQAIPSEYFDVNGVLQVCASCRDVIERQAQPPRGAAPFVRAGLFGLGAAIAGAALYYAVIAITEFEIGLVSIAIGYMVGFAIRKGTGGLGGRAFQVMAVVLTYWAVGLAYVPLVVTAAVEQRAAAEAQAKEPGGTSAESAVGAGEGQPASATDTADVESVGWPLFVAWAIYFSFQLPVLVVFGSLPSGLISAAIIGFGMHQAWRMTAAPHVTITGPFRVGAAEHALT
jgi:hypothetical protein